MRLINYLAYFWPKLGRVGRGVLNVSSTHTPTNIGILTTQRVIKWGLTFPIVGIVALTLMATVAGGSILLAALCTKLLGHSEVTGWLSCIISMGLSTAKFIFSYMAISCTIFFSNHTNVIPNYIAMMSNGSIIDMFHAALTLMLACSYLPLEQFCSIIYTSAPLGLPVLWTAVKGSILYIELTQLPYSLWAFCKFLPVKLMTAAAPTWIPAFISTFFIDIFSGVATTAIITLIVRYLLG